jgi:hypothetical protein
MPGVMQDGVWQITDKVPVEMTTHKILRWLVPGLFACASLANGQSFVPTSDNLLDLYSGPIEWADLDNDDDLDIIHQGFADGANEFFTNVYENVNGSFVARTTALPHLRNAGLALGDYDKDGDLDVLLSGLSASGNISVLYRNNGAFSFSLTESFPGVLNSTPSWFDIDNDEDLDFLIAGVDDNTPTADFVIKMFVYENTGSSFVPLTTTGLPPCSQCSIDWADSNGDGKIDVVMMGFDENFSPSTHVYLNTGNKTFVEDTQSIFKQAFNGDVKWGDFDNDGDMDVLFAGILPGGTISTQVYENINGVLKVRDDIVLYPTGETWFGGSKWVDYNNDGLLDILISGRGSSVIVVERIMELYKNNGDGTFQKVQEENFTDFAASSVDFGDYDNDGDLDMAYTGLNSMGAKSGIFENKLSDGTFITNNKPLPPASAGLKARPFRKRVSFHWQSGSDQQTPSDALSYNFYLRNGSSKIISPTSDFATGYLLTSNPANGRARVGIAANLPEGNNYSWAVQSIDGSKSGSLFSGENTFYYMYGPEAKKAEILSVTSVKLTWIDNSAIETSYQVIRSVQPTTGFSSPVMLAMNASTYTDNFAFLTDTYYYYRIYAANATGTSGYDSLKVVIPTAPGELSAQTINAATIALAWKDNTAYETGYEIERRPSGGGTYVKIATLAAGSVAYENTNLSEGTGYEYRVRAINEYGASGPHIAMQQLGLPTSVHWAITLQRKRRRTKYSPLPRKHSRLRFRILT